jgi:hypothetical protein
VSLRCPLESESPKHSSNVRIVPLILLVIFLNTSAACLTVIRHNEDVAAASAVQFAQTAIINQDYRTAYQQLSQESQRAFTVDRLKDLINEMHPKNWPRSITATEYEPVPGLRRVKIFLYGKGGDEDIIYMFVMDGTAETGYKVSGIFRLQTPLRASTSRKPLPVRRTAN